MTDDEFNQLADGSWKYEIETLRTRVAELEDRVTEVPQLMRQLAACVKELEEERKQHLAACEYALSETRKQQDYFLKECNEFWMDKLAAVTKERDEFEEQRDAAWFELRKIRVAIGASMEESTADEVERIMAKLAASQHYAQQLRKAMQQSIDEQYYSPIIKALSLPHDTSALDALVKDAERYRWFREKLPNVIFDSYKKSIFLRNSLSLKDWDWNGEQLDAAIDAARSEK
jgi:chromosome segregation ATPase